jgi:hypothetical protein
LSLGGKVLHTRSKIGIVDIERELRVERLLYDGRVTAVVFASPCIQYAYLPPKPSTHFDLEWSKPEVCPISMNAECLRDSHHQSRESPYDSSVAVSSQTDQEYDESLKYHELLRVEKASTRQGLFDSKAISCK